MRTILDMVVASLLGRRQCQAGVRVVAGLPLGWTNGKALPEEMTIRAFGLLGDACTDGAVGDGSGVAMVAPFRLSLTG
jgi:hypothetical protein